MKKILLVVIGLVLVAGVSYWVIRQVDYSEKKVSAPLQEVNLRLKWMHQAQFAGNYVAIEKGFYGNEGLKVNVTPIDFNESTIDTIIAGKADFGVSSADEIILAREKGIPVKAFAVIYKINPITAYALKKSGITKPQDFVGKTVGIEKAVNVEYLYAAMMSKLGIDRSKVKEVAIGYDASELLLGKTDVSTGYIINEPHQAMEAGQEITTILMADYGVNMYADVLFTTEKTIEKKPDLVLSFLKATLRGWQYAFEHEAEAVDIIVKYATKSTKTHEAYMLHTSAPLIHTGSSALGAMDANEWERAQTILVEQKLLTKPIVITSAYTTQFLDFIYKK
ncbi:MAG: ABC transporter substrate-binding protein [Candidatus Paceibacterota bacterium]|jgi:ABC-type nitrate/sulfonate/bicarbonate transport system substrate-binding protein